MLERLKDFGRNVLIGAGFLIAFLALLGAALLEDRFLSAPEDRIIRPASEVRLEWLDGASCGDWLALDREQRLALIMDLVRGLPEDEQPLARPAVGERRITSVCRGREDALVFDAVDEAAAGVEFAN